MNKIFLMLILPVFISCKNNAGQKMPQENKTSTEMSKKNSLEGSWELVYMSLPDNNFDSLYAQRKPYIVFDTTKKRFSGNSSCNSFNGQLKTEGNKIDFSIPIIMTKMFCEGGGEKIFMENLEKTNTFNIYHDNLIFSINGIVLMKFIRKTDK